MMREAQWAYFWAYLLDHLEELVSLIEALSFLLHLILEALPFIVELAQLVLHIRFALGIANEQLLARGLCKLLDALLEQLGKWKESRAYRLKRLPKKIYCSSFAN